MLYMVLRPKNLWGVIRPNEHILDRNNLVGIPSLGSLILYMVFKAEKFRGGYKAERTGIFLSSYSLLAH